MTEIDPISVTFVRAIRPASDEWFRPARDRLRVQSGNAESFVRFRVDVPERRELVSADLRASAEDAVTGNLLARSVDPDEPNAYRNMTWNRRPANIAGLADRTATVWGSRNRSLTWGVTADISDAIAASRDRVAFRLSSSTTARQWLDTSSVVLELTTRPASRAPSDVSPSGVVGTTKPVFSWTSPYAITKVQVQIDDATDFASPVYDSGELVSTTPRVDTETQGPAWAGLSGTMHARVRHFTSAGWSVWEDVTITYLAPTVYTVTNPDGADADPSPPSVWTPAAEAVEIVSFLDGVRLGTTGLIKGPISTYTPKQKAQRKGQVLRRVHHLYDGEERVQPAYTRVVTETTFTPKATVAGLSTLTVEQLDGLPAAQVAWTRTAGVPDEVGIYRSGDLIAQPNGPDGAWLDWLLPPNTDLTYGATAVVNGEHSDAVIEFEHRNVVEGVWIVDPYTGDGFESGDLADVRGFVLDGLGIEIAHGRVAVVHTPIDGAVLLRRTLTMRGPEGTVRGRLGDWPGRTKAQQKADAEWLAARPERTLRVIMGDLNMPFVGEIDPPLFDPVESFTHDIKHNVSITFSHAGGL